LVTYLPETVTVRELVGIYLPHSPLYHGVITLVLTGARAKLTDHE
jgi:hypothetical protein